MFENQTIAITGRLASMSRDGAMDRIKQLGGMYITEPDQRTDILIVGEGGTLLGDDGRLTQALQSAHALQAQGHPIRILSETDWIRTLGEAAPANNMRYAATQLARMVGVSRTDVRRWVRAGALRPTHTVGRLAFFGFQQIAQARSLKALQDDGVPISRIVASLAQLRRWFSGDVDPTQLTTLGNELVVETEQGDHVDGVGQLQLAFDAPDKVREVAAPALSLVPRRSRFDDGVQAEEEGRWDDARLAYERAIALEGPRAEVCFNLGNVLHALGRTSEAASRFREAVSQETDYVEAWNNLGNVLGALYEPDEALRAYRHALAIEPLYADAHFNLAQTLEEQGERAQARTHWQTYLSMDSEGAWADEARRQLGK